MSVYFHLTFNNLIAYNDSQVIKSPATDRMSGVEKDLVPGQYFVTLVQFLSCILLEIATGKLSFQ